MDFLTVCYIVLVVCVVVLVFAIYKFVSVQTAYNAAKDCFSSSNGTLRLDKRGKIWKKKVLKSYTVSH